jgi:RNA polymerase sigma-70 factor (ECF subfamily)
MSGAANSSLLEKLNRGDSGAVAEAFREYAPYLRLVIRRQMPARYRGKFDSSDVVQSVWADVVEGLKHDGWRFRDDAQVRAFLARIARNRLIDRLRHHQNALSHERPIQEADPEWLPESGQPRPSEVMQAEELWQRLQTLCPPAHREVLRLKRQGLPLAAIAASTGLHEGSVRRILYDLARRLALRDKTVPHPHPDCEDLAHGRASG